MIKDVIIKCPCYNKMNKVQLSFSKGTDDVKIIGVFNIKEDENIKEQKKIQEELFEKQNILLGEGVTL